MIGTAALLVLAVTTGAPSQNSAAAAGDADARRNAGSPLPGGGTTKDLTMPGEGGVAGTGLGGSTDGSGDGATSGKTAAPGTPGTGLSVKGPAGQGIGGQGTSEGIGAPGAATSGAAGTGAAR